MENPDLKVLKEIALDLRWSWNHAADKLFRMLEPELWDSTQSAWLVLQTVSKKKLSESLANPAFRKELDEVLRVRTESAARKRWFHETHGDQKFSAIAYFSLEFMLSEALPIYSGGLGNVAGDQLKAAHDLGVPVIGIGLLYDQGYFRQHIDAKGNQIALTPVNDPGQLPVVPVRDNDGEWLRIPVAVPGGQLLVRAWRAQVGQRTLYLLDTNDPANLPEHRTITSELYGGGPELRLEQERVLGIVGWRLLRALGMDPEVCHLNEGHAAFAILERARDYMREHNTSFASALAVTRAGNLFTTHTPVAAGFDQFPPELIGRRMREYAEQELGISMHDFFALGRADEWNNNEPFNMAWLAVRGSGAVNGVSKLHGEVSRHIFSTLFPRWPESEIPIVHVTNGVHTPTWDSEESDDLWDKTCGPDRWTGDLTSIGDNLRKTSSPDLWNMRNNARQGLVEYVRERISRQIAGHGGSREEIDAAAKTLNPDVLTLGFARRFATYKRPGLLLTDPDRLLRILTNPNAPVQIILAGKAHPADYEGQKLIQRWVEFIRGTAARAHAVFLADYDMQLAQRLVQGVDLWVNNPRRPWEASGTSGMKVLSNGGLNCSELDGWWVEAYAPEVGWALGDGQQHGADRDNIEAGQLYDLLEHEIIPAFYTRDVSGMPTHWIDRVRESMARLTPLFSANRAVRQYTEQHYIPAAKAFADRTRSGGDDLANWRAQIDQHWPSIRFGELHIHANNFTVEVDLAGLNPDFVRVELFADGASPITMNRNGNSYSATVNGDREASDFTPRIVPAHPQAYVPLECPQILWLR